MIFLERSSQASALVSKVAKTSDPAGSVEKPCKLPVQNPVQGGNVLRVNHRFTAEHPGASKHPQLVHKVYRFNTAVSHPLVKGLRI